MSAEEHVSIEGTLLMLDDTTPHVAVPVQVICDGEVAATTLSDKAGRYQFTSLKPGRYRVRCHILDGSVYYGEAGSMVMDESRAIFLQVRHGVAHSNIDFRFAPFKKGTWKTYDTLDGLADNFILSFYCDPDGVMWFGTVNGGVSRYDGKEFVNLTTKDGLANNRVNGIHSDPDGVMWFGTHGGVSRYDGKEFVNLTIKDGLADNAVNATYCDPDGVVWFGTDSGVSRYDGKEFVNVTVEDGLVDNNVWAIHRDPDGVMWFATWSGGVSRYDGKEFVNFTTEDGLVDNTVSAIHRDPDGVMWFGTGHPVITGGGISRYDGREFVNITTKNGLVHNTVFAIHRDPDGVMWFGAGEWEGGRGGLSRYDDKGFVNFTTEDGLGHNYVTGIYRDLDGVLWVTTWGGGISRYNDKDFITLTTKDGLVDNTVSAIHCDPDGVMWFGTDGGVSRYDGEDFVNLTTEGGLVDNTVRAIHRDPDGVIWFGTCGGWGREGGGISRYDGKGFVNFTTEDGLAHNYVTGIHCDSDGMMWIAAGSWVGGRGVSRYDGKEFVNLSTEDGLVDNRLSAIHCGPGGAVWIGTAGGWDGKSGGVSRYDGKEFVNFTTEDGLVHNRVWTIHRDPDGMLWFGTNGGVSRYDGKEFVNFTTEDGLVHNRVWAIHRDLDGVMWFATEGGGVSGYDGAAWTSLDTRDGLADNNVGAILQDLDGYLWFGTARGITRYRRSTTPPKVYIVSVIADQTYRDVSAIPAFTPGTRITIEYSSIDFKTLPEKRQYRCRIQAFGKSLSKREMDSDWRKPTKATSSDFVFDEPGTYTFEVQAIDRDLNYSESATLKLTIEPDPVLVSLQTEVNHLRREVGQKYHFEDIIGRSAAIRQVRALMERAIDSGLTVLITGETGTGKELVAKAIHHNSPRKNHPLLDRNCGAIPKELLAGDLFGYRKGAFTGANEDRIGLFEAASGGTVLLDEISEMTQDAQIHLLRVLEERKVRRLGENVSRDVDVRIIAMTSKDLIEAGKAGLFREDLYYRLSEFPISIPPLRERLEDIPLLAEHFLQEYSQEQKKELGGFASGLFKMLQSYSWPGNVRELRNAVRRAAALVEEGELIHIHHFPLQITNEIVPTQEIMQEIGNSSTRYRDLVDRFERGCIEHALRVCKGNRSQAAKMLRLGRRSLYEKMQRLGIHVPEDE